MLTIDIPGAQPLQLDHLVLDFNGTLARDGLLLDGVADLLTQLAAHVRVHVVTGDTFGGARAALQGLPCKLVVLGGTDQAQAKRNYVEQLGPQRVACVGNGRNDRLMMDVVTLAIGVIQAEGASPRTISSADVVTRDGREALELLLHPLRLAATLRT